MLLCAQSQDFQWGKVVRYPFRIKTSFLFVVPRVRRTLRRETTFLSPAWYQP
jgi:hypothetical protein